MIFAVILSVFACLIVAGCATAQATFADEPKEPQYFNYVCDWNKTEPPVGFAKVIEEQKAAEAAQQQAVDNPPVEGETWAYAPSEGYDESLNNNLAYLDGGRYNNSFRSDGVAHIGDTEFKWYSQNVMPGGGLEELNNNGRHVDEESGFVVDGDGFIAVASPWGRDEIGTEVETPFGTGKVYDVNEGDAYDLYTDF